MKFSTLRNIIRKKYKIIGMFNTTMIRFGIKKLTVDADKDEYCELRLNGWVVIKSRKYNSQDMIPITMVSEELQEAFVKEMKRLKLGYAK